MLAHMPFGMASLSNRTQVRTGLLTLGREGSPHAISVYAVPRCKGMYDIAHGHVVLTTLSPYTIACLPLAWDIQLLTYLWAYRSDVAATRRGASGAPVSVCTASMSSRWSAGRRSASARHPTPGLQTEDKLRRQSARAPRPHPCRGRRAHRHPPVAPPPRRRQRP
jgi:hypothetical protein